MGKKEAKRVSTVALKVGTRVDQMIQDSLSNKTVKYKPTDSIEVKNCYQAWLEFKRDYSPDVIAFQEEILYPDQDLVGHLDLRTSDMVIDVKCASSIKKSYWLQVSKYSRGFLMPAILRLDKNLGVYEFKTAEQAKVDVNEAIKVFDGLLEAYRFYNAPKEQEDEVCQQ